MFEFCSEEHVRIEGNIVDTFSLAQIENLNENFACKVVLSAEGSVVHSGVQSLGVQKDINV